MAAHNAKIQYEILAVTTSHLNRPLKKYLPYLSPAGFLFDKAWNTCVWESNEFLGGHIYYKLVRIWGYHICVKNSIFSR